MKITLLILSITIMSLMYSCNDEKQDVAPATPTSFDIGNTHYVSNKTIAYQTEFGQLLKVTGENFDLYIVFSDTTNKTFTISDSLFASDMGKARCIFKTGNTFKFSTTGTITYDTKQKSGTFEINAEGMDLINGQIKVDTIINNSNIDFTTITENDVNGWPITQEDKADWIIRTQWEDAERFIFNLYTQNTLPRNIKITQYPNPYVSQFNIHMDLPQEYWAIFYIVNSNFEIEQNFIGVTSGNTILQLNHNLIKGKCYRLYYKIYSESESLYGSGDLKIME